LYYYRTLRLLQSKEGPHPPDYGTLNSSSHASTQARSQPSKLTRLLIRRFQQILQTLRCHLVAAFLFIRAIHLGRLLLLQEILFLLTVPAPNTLGCQTLFTKGRPRSKVLAALAPLDFQAFLAHDHDYPNGNITSGTDTLVLTGDNVHTGIVTVAFVGSSGCLFTIGRPASETGGRANTEFATHDAVLVAFRGRVASLVDGTIVHEQVKLGKLHVLRLVTFTADLLIKMKNRM
jgi:hypothetical protein